MKTIYIWLLVCVLATECSHSAKLSKLTGRDPEAFPAVESDVESSNTELNGDDRRENEIKREKEYVYCPSNFTYLIEAGSCYKVLLDLQDWESAGASCAKQHPGAHLAAMLNERANSAVKKFFKLTFEKEGKEACQGGFFWTSGQTKFANNCSDGVYLWKVLSEKWLPFTYTDWHKGEPNCHLRKETCKFRESCVDLIAPFHFQWNDERCDNTLCSLCQFDALPE